MFKNIPVAEVTELNGLVTYQPGQVVSRTLTQDGSGSLTLFAFPKGEGLSTHTTVADALLLVLDGEAEVEVAGKTSVVRMGEAIVLPASVPHAVSARQEFKMLLVVST